MKQSASKAASAVKKVEQAISTTQSQMAPTETLQQRIQRVWEELKNKPRVRIDIM